MSEGPIVDSAVRTVFHIRPFRNLFITRMASNAANQMQTVAVGWQIYLLTGSAIDLGLVGLVQFIPPLLLTLVAGQVVDQVDRRNLLRLSYTAQGCVSLTLFVLTMMGQASVSLILLLLFFNGTARTFEGPALQSLLPTTVPREFLMRAVSANASAGKLSQLVGPALGGFLLTLGNDIVYVFCVLTLCIAFTTCTLLPRLPPPPQLPKATWSTVVAGLTFIWGRPAILGAMTLDLVATLFGGVTALLPIFARDILQIDAWGFGLLRSSPALGGLLMAVAISRLPVTKNAGWVMFTAMGVYGSAILAFGFSTSPVLSILLLMFMGAGDMLSTIIRQTLIQFAAPDEMRGRIFAVNTLFVGTAGHLGTFESGVTAEWFGAVGSVVLGGAAVFIIVGLWAWRFPMLRDMNRPDDFVHERETG